MNAPLPAAAFQNVGKTFGDKVSLREVTFEVPAGACFGLAGVNGAGKTTLIKCLLDAVRPDAGSVQLFGVPSTETRARAALAFLPERFNAPFYATGRDFLVFMGRLYGHSLGDAGLRDALAELDLEADALDRPVKTYSKGMTQKLGLAACLASGRRLLVLDEPTSGLDPKARALFKQALRKRHAAGATVLLTSHALADIEELCTHLAVLHRGEVRFAGPPAGLLEPGGHTSLEAAFLACLERPEPATPRGSALAQ